MFFKKTRKNTEKNAEKFFLENEKGEKKERKKK